MVRERILVTGGNGLIGSHLIDELVKYYEVYNLDNHFPGWGNKYINPVAHQINGDLRNFEQVDFALTNIDCCVHLGAISHVKTCRENPHLAYSVNVGGTINVLEACRKNDIKRIVIAGSDHIYGKQPLVMMERDEIINQSIMLLKDINRKLTYVDETVSTFAALREPDIYGQTKAIQVILSEIYYKQYGLPVVMTASGNVFSSRQSKPNVIPNFVDAALKNEDLIIHGNGEQTRDFYYIDNLVDAYIKCIEIDGIDGELFNIGSGKNISIKTIANKVLELIPESNSKIKYVDDIINNAMDMMPLSINKAMEKLGYKVKVSFEDGLKKTIDEWRLKLNARIL